jgi:hypothetical protein
MTRRTLSRSAGPLAVAGLGVLLLALSACASSSGAAPSASPSGSSSAPSQEIEVDAAWLDAGRMIGLVTQGSSSKDCIPIADDVSYTDGVLEVTLAEPEGDVVCTADYVPRVTLVGLPEGVDAAEGLEIRVTGDGYLGDTELDGLGSAAPAGETDYLPSAGWTETDGQFVLLTWGSSSCAPVISGVAATAPAEVTVTFETPPADQVCTMDMAPRATIAYVDGLEEDSDVEAVLTGSPEFVNVRIPIYGEN